MRDLHNNIQLKRAISPVNAGSGDTPIVSQIIDRQGYDSLEFLIATGSLADANATFTVLVEDGDDSDLVDDGAAVADSELLGTEAGASFAFGDDDEVRKIGYIGHKRYVRLTITPSGNTGDVYVSAVAVLAKADMAPVTQASA
jgi:hypothetical protein